MPKKGDEIEETVEGLLSASHGTCKIHLGLSRSYVQWLDPDTAKWATLFGSTSLAHQCHCRFLRDKLGKGSSKEIITKIVADLKIASGPKGRARKSVDVRTY